MKIPAIQVDTSQENADRKQFVTISETKTSKYCRMGWWTNGLDVNTDVRWRIFPRGTQTPVFQLEIPSDNPSKSVVETRTLNEVVNEQAILSPVALLNAASEPIVVPTPVEPKVFPPMNLEDFRIFKWLEA